MKHLSGLMLVLLALMPLAGLGGVVDGVAAYVNGDVVTIGDVREEMSQTLRIPRGVSREEQEQALRKQYYVALQRLVDRRLIIHAYADTGMEIPDEIVDRRAETLISERFGGERQRLLQQLAAQDMTYQEWWQTIKDSMIVSSMRWQYAGQYVSVSPKSIKDYYDANTDEFRQPPGARVRLIVLRLPDDEAARSAVYKTAEVVAERIAKGGDFGAIARQFSQGTAADQGGDRGWIIPEDELRRELVEALKPLKEGGTSALIETPEELYFVKKEAVRDDSVRPLSEVSGDIQQKLFRGESRRLFMQWVEKLRARAYVRTFEYEKQNAEQEQEGEVTRNDKPDKP